MSDELRKIDFLDKVCVLSTLIQEWTMGKAYFKGIASPCGIRASIVAADIIISSNWGSHKLAQPDYKNRYSNNLVLLETGPYWDGRKQVYEGKEYRAYKNWRYFAEDFSDYLIWSGLYDEVLRAHALESQLEEYCKTKPSPICYNKVLKKVIDNLKLTGMDFNGCQTKKP